VIVIKKLFFMFMVFLFWAVFAFYVFAGTVTVIALIIQMSFIECNENVVYICSMIAVFAGTVVGTFLAIDFYEESIESVKEIFLSKKDD